MNHHRLILRSDIVEVSANHSGKRLGRYDAVIDCNPRLLKPTRSPKERETLNDPEVFSLDEQSYCLFQLAIRTQKQICSEVPEREQFLARSFLLGVSRRNDD
jgi:hypothetical protein